MSKRTTKRVTVVLTATFHGNYLDKDEVAGYLETWIDAGLEDRDDLRTWKVTATGVDEIQGDPDRYDSDDTSAWVCVAGNGDEYPEHDYDDVECSRCGAEPDA